jgi:hypothetical protein
MASVLGVPVSAGFAPQNLDAPASAPPLQKSAAPPQSPALPRKAPLAQTRRKPAMKRGVPSKQMGQRTMRKR